MAGMQALKDSLPGRPGPAPPRSTGATEKSGTPNSENSENSESLKQELLAQRLDCGCPVYRRDGMHLVGDHVCCLCQDAGWVLVPTSSSERVRMRPADQVTPCRCQQGKAEPNWAEQAGIPKHYRGWRLDRWEPGQNAMALDLALVYTMAWPPKPFLVLSFHYGEAVHDPEISSVDNIAAALVAMLGYGAAAYILWLLTCARFRAETGPKPRR